jgi:GntR family transcriptional repressor for pyruvate dehydrogenase complex
MREPLHKDVMAALISDIVAGSQPPGSTLPTITEIADRFDVSRGVARETLRAMQERGLISIKQGKSGVVNPTEDWDTFDPDVLSATLVSSGGADILEHYFEVRRILEVEAAGLAAARAGADDLRQMESALGQMDQAALESKERPQDPATPRRFNKADIAFHESIIAATGNSALKRLIKRIHLAAIGRTLPIGSPSYWLESAQPQHRAVLEAVRDRDSEGARQAMGEHVDTVKQYHMDFRAAALSGTRS